MVKCNECGTIAEERIDGRGKVRCTSCWSLNVIQYAPPAEIVAPKPIVESVAEPIKHKATAKKGKA